MSQTSIEGREAEANSLAPMGLKVAKYTINAGKTRNGDNLFLADTTVILDGPPLIAGDLILNVLTDCEEVFGDADAGDDTTLNIRFNDGSTQTNIVAATSIGGAPFSTVSRVLSIQDFATAGDWLKLTLSTRVEVVVSNDQNIDDGLLHVYVCYISPKG